MNGQDHVNDGGTRYRDREGKDLTEQEYARILKRAQNAPAAALPVPETTDKKEVKTDDR
jgi:hypothetical protein